MKVETKEEPITCDLLSRQRTVIMGLAILSVIFFHYTDDCMTYKMYNEGFIKWYWIYVKSSGVDIFLFLSGLSLYYAMKKNSDIVRFYKRRLVRILIPYFLIAVPTWVILDMVLKGEGIKDVVLHLSFLTFFYKRNKVVLVYRNDTCMLSHISGYLCMDAKMQSHGIAVGGLYSHMPFDYFCGI